MTSCFRVYPYGPSNTATSLVEGLDGLLIKRERSRYIPNRNHVVINWGSGTRPAILPPNWPVINSFEAVRTAISKLRTFEVLRQSGVSIPDVTTSQEQAQSWLSSGARVVGRDVDSGHSGAGARVYHERQDQVVGPHRFYTKYWRKQREFRIHIFNDSIIFRQEKVKHGGQEADPYIRSHGRGWGFAFHRLNEHPVPVAVDEIAKSACRSLGLHFAGVDIGWNERYGPCVFELNTAPGLENSSLASYIQAFIAYQAR